LSEIKFGAFHRTSCPLHPGEFARKAEDLGFDSVWVGEIPCNREACFDAISALSFAAAATTRVRLGTNVVITPLHHPAWLAREWATLDVLSGGRAIPGLGVGGEPGGLGVLLRPLGAT
jgi:alkanesulfonate monooxygenase SsuD/methylene tetrahydromethanopterin reductase-like flavin-dependent oxidoreductase (luciferase family)